MLDNNYFKLIHMPANNSSLRQLSENRSRLKQTLRQAVASKNARASQKALQNIKSINARFAREFQRAQSNWAAPQSTYTNMATLRNKTWHLAQHPTFPENKRRQAMAALVKLNDQRLASMRRPQQMQYARQLLQQLKHQKQMHDIKARRPVNASRPANMLRAEQQRVDARLHAELSKMYGRMMLARLRRSL